MDIEKDRCWFVSYCSQISESDGRGPLVLCRVIQLTQMLKCYITTVLMDISHLSAKLNLLPGTPDICSGLSLHIRNFSVLMLNMIAQEHAQQFSLKMNSM